MADGRYALLVASSRYSDATLARLEAPENDAESLAGALGTPTIGGFAVQTVVDRPAAEVMQEVEAFCDGRRREDLLLLYFSGHGILDEGARLYFATVDTRVDRPRSTAVASSFVNEVMSECRSRRQVLVLDCCNSGAFARGVKAGGAVGTGGRFEGRGRVVITASDALQYAWEGDRIDGSPVRSVFTQVLVEGLRTGEADLDRDGYVTLDELYDYAYGRVLDVSPRQRPQKWAFEVEGKLVVARAAAAGEARDPPPPFVSAPEAHRLPRVWQRIALARRRTLVAAAAAVVILAAAALTGILLLDDPPSNESPSLLDDGRNATLEVFEAWQRGELDLLRDAEISASARRALEQLPTEPITPGPPAADDCYGSPDDVSCSYDYPGLGIYLTFRALEYSTGMRVAEVSCHDSQTGDQPEGGIATCAQMVESS